MTTYSMPNRAPTAGIPSQDSDTFTLALEGLITGDLPAVVTEDLTFAASQTIPAWTPVGFDGSGDLVPAVSGTTEAIGITVIAVTTPASGAKKGAPVYRSGVFNPAVLNWPASYNTDALKLAAFRGAPTPTNIVVRPVKTDSVTLP